MIALSIKFKIPNFITGMKNIIHGILRSVVALAFIYTVYVYVSMELRFSSLGLTGSGYWLGFLIGVILCLCVIFYMSINGVRDFMKKRIKLRALYVIVALLTLITLLSTSIRLSRSIERPLTKMDLVSYLSLLLMLYFTVVDFIELFIKKGEEKLYTDSDFEAADSEN